MQNISEIEELIKLISNFWFSPKSAKRIVLKLIQQEELTKPIAKALAEVYNGVSRCKDCGSLKSNSLGCKNCSNSKNKFNKICIVENISDQWTIENSNIYQGYYHILGGTISSSNGSSKQDLLIESLIKRIKEDEIDEVILATSATVEGQTTAFTFKIVLKISMLKFQN